MKVLGISPLDKDATASLVEDGKVLFAAAEERFSRIKQHAGFPTQAIEKALHATNTKPEEIDLVVYAFLSWDREALLKKECVAFEREFQRDFPLDNLQRRLAQAETRVTARSAHIPGLRHPNQRVQKGILKKFFYRIVGATPAFSRAAAHYASWARARVSARQHRSYQEELHGGLERLGLQGKLKRFEHHFAHASNAYLASGFDRALVVTLDGYGSGLAGSISIGEAGLLRRLHNLRFPCSLGSLYENVTSSLGFVPDRHAGKVVGLAAYGDPNVLLDVLKSRYRELPGDFRLVENLNIYFSRHLSTRFPIVDVAAAHQRFVELAACNYVRYWARETGCRKVVLSGGVAANVKMNQRIHELEEVDDTFIYPNMGDGGCGTGLALYQTWPGGVGGPIPDVYWGPSFSDAEIRYELERQRLPFEVPANMAAEVARRVYEGEVIARFDGRMEYGPRALGNRSVLYHARDPQVNQWLNARLGRTEFMPFAPVTLWEARDRCYQHLRGAEHAAEFMTITFDCTDWMREHCPAAVHVDGTARPQLIRREVNPAYYEIVKEYEKLSGIPCLINTSFNMHEEPIVCSPRDAVRAFLQGNLDGLAIGPYLVPNPVAREKRGASRER